MIAQLFFQVKHLQKKKQDLETLCVYQIGIYRADSTAPKPPSDEGGGSPKGETEGEKMLDFLFC